MATQYLTVGGGEFVSDVTEVEFTEVIETRTVTEIIEYTEIDGVVTITGRDFEVDDVVEVVKETRQFGHNGRFREIREITEFSDTVDIETQGGRITEVDETLAIEQATQVQESCGARIEEIDTTREFGRITEVHEISDVGKVKEVGRIDMNLDLEVDTLFYGRQPGVKAITDGTEVAEAHVIDTGARSNMYIGWNSAQNMQAGTSTVTNSAKLEETIKESPKVDVKATEGITKVTETREFIETDADLELEADTMFIYTGWNSKQDTEQPRSPTIGDGARIGDVVEETPFAYQQRPSIAQYNTNSSMTTLNHTSRSSYSDSTAGGASTDGFFKTPRSYPPVPPLPAAYANRTLVNLDLGTRTSCTGQCRTTTIDQARRLMEVTAMSKKSSFKPFFRILLLAAFVILCTLGIAAILLIYIWTGKIEVNYWQIVTAVPQGSVLLITTFATKVILICIPFLLAIMAYYIATAWAMRNASVTQVERRDCGCVVTRTSDNQTTVIANEEYGLLLGLLKGATIFTLWATIRYYIFRSTSKQRKAASRPLIQAFSVLLMAIIILYCVIGLDFALHHASYTDYIPIRGPAIPAALLPSTNTTLYSRALKSECISPNANGAACTVTTQTVLGATSLNTTTSFQEGLQTLAGLSSTNFVAFAPFQRTNGSSGQMALLVDNSHPVDQAFTAKTIGIHTQCELISPYCDMTTDCDENHSPPTTHPNGTILARHPTCTGFSCSMPEWPTYWDEGMTNRTSFFLSEPLEIRNDPALYSLQEMPSYLATGQNSFRFISSLSSYVDPSTLQNVCTQWLASGVCTKGNDNGYVYSSQTPIEATPFYRKLITGCTVSIMDVEYEHFNGKYTVRQDTAQLSNNATALALSSVLYTTDTRTTAVGIAIAALVTSNANSSIVASTMETSVSRMMLAMGQAAFEATPAIDVVFTINIPITILPTALVVAFVAFLVLFSLLTIALAVLALITINKSLWMQRKRVEKAAGATGTASAAASPTAACDNEKAHETLPRPSPLRTSTMPPPPERLWSDKTVVGDNGNNTAGYCS